MFLGIDTSNYTTSLALFSEAKGTVADFKNPLPVREGAIGLRQSDAVFHHVQNLPVLFDACRTSFGRLTDDISGIGVSVRPRDVEESYMPCFTVGHSFARSLANLMDRKVYTFSHQAGHIAAALYSVKRLDLIRQRFIAFHFSGGTSEAVLCEPDENFIFSTTPVASGLDLKAGQVMDRVGAMLGLPFPAGPALDALAAKSEREFAVRPTFKGYNPCMSGIENQCRTMLARGESAKDIAKFAVCSVCAVVDRMTADCKARFGNLPILYAGGVMGNSYISRVITEKYGGYFAQPRYSSDNAVGAAVLAAYRSGLF